MAIPEKGIPAKILSKLSKEQFKPGDAVCFTWFGVKRYGYVKRFKEVNWGIQYTISLGKMSYPCGIEVDGYKTKYTTGLVKYDETIQLGQEQLRTLAESSEPMYQRVIYSNQKSIDEPISEFDPGTRNDSRVNTGSIKHTEISKRNSKPKDTVCRTDASTNIDKVNPVKTRRRSKQDVDELGDAGMHPSDWSIGGNTKKTKKPSVEIQQSILSNFFKNID